MGESSADCADSSLPLASCQICFVLESVQNIQSYILLCSYILVYDVLLLLPKIQNSIIMLEFPFEFNGTSTKISLITCQGKTDQ